MKRTIFWISLFNVVLTLILIALEWETGLAGGRISALCGWFVATYETAG